MKRSTANTRQRQIYFYILDYWIRHDTTPRQRQIAYHLNLSQPYVYHHLKELERKCWIQMNPYHHRLIDIVGIHKRGVNNAAL